jgi:hypothetical protein
MVFEPFTFSLVVGAIAKGLAGKAVVAKGAAIAKGAAAKGALHSSHAAIHAAHASSYALSGSTTAITVFEGIAGLTLGVVGVAVLQDLLEGRNVGPTGEKVAAKMAFCVENNAMDRSEATKMMNIVQGMSENGKQKMNAGFNDIVRQVLEEECL